MNNWNLTIQNFFTAVIHHWKWMIGIIFVFLAAGLVCGKMFSHLASAEGNGSAQVIQEAQFSESLELDYYNTCYDNLTEQKQMLIDYANKIRLDKTTTSEQVRQLTEYCEKLDNYETTVLSKILEKLTLTGNFYVPDELREEAVSYYTYLQKTTEDALIKAQSARELLDSIGGLSTTNEEINSIYSAILSLANKYVQYQLDLQNFEEILYLLQDDYSTLYQNSQQMELSLADAAADLNLLIQEGNSLFNEISKSNHLNITYQIVENKAIYNIAHTTRLATSSEAFSAFVFFFVLVGICVGYYVALCKEAKLNSSPNKAEQKKS